jgi:hypothetical protein
MRLYDGPRSPQVHDVVGMMKHPTPRNTRAQAGSAEAKSGRTGGVRSGKANPTDRPAVGSAKKATRKAQILRSTHVHRSRAHTSSFGRRRQARRDVQE